MSKLLKFGIEARQELVNGAGLLARAVTTTLGPKGNNVALDRPWGYPAVVHDGVSVAKDIDLDDEFQNVGAKLVKQAATQTGDGVGDGTTTSILLAHEMAVKGLEKIKKGHNAMFLRKGMEKASQEVLRMVDLYSKPVKSKEDLVRVSTISAGDPEIGQKIADALEKVGQDGLVTVEEGSTTSIEVEYKEGMQFDQGYISPYFSNRPERMDVMMEDVHILLADQKLTSIADLAGVEQFAAKVGGNLLILASDVEGEALETLVLTKLKRHWPVVCVRVPGFAEGQREMLTDISYVVGGVVLSPESGRDAKQLSPDFSELGHAEKVWVNRDTCRIIGGAGTKESVNTRIQQLKTRSQESTSEYEKTKLSERIAKLTGGVAIIKVGAPSESEMKEKLERARDAVEATRAATEEGIVPGGGTTLFEIYSTIDNMIESDNTSDINAGIEIVRDALMAPITKLLSNAGYTEEEIINRLQGLPAGKGYDINTGEMVDMIEKGIIDPTKVTKMAFQNAVSVAGNILTTDCIVTDKKEPKSLTADSGMY